MKAEKNNDILKKNLEWLLKRKNKTKKELEEELQLGKGFLSKLDSEPGLYKIKELAELLEVTVDELAYEHLEEVFENESYKRNESKFLDKIIEETKIGKLKWSKPECNSFGSWEEYPQLFRTYGDEGCKTYESMFCENRTGNIDGYEIILEDTEGVLIVGIIDYQSECKIYELYMKIEETIYPIFYGQRDIDEDKFRVLDQLWKSIEIDMPKMVLTKTFKKYIDKNN